MSRSLTTDLKNETQAASLAPAFFAFFDFQAGAVRVWSGVGDKVWGGNTYNGLGYLGTMSPIEESADLKANGVAFQLSGVPSTLIATVLGDNYQGRDVKLWFGALDQSDTIIADPYQIFAGRMDAVEIDDGTETATIRVHAESRMIDLRRNNERRYTHEDQQLDFPGDDGLKFMPTAQTTPFVWGSTRVASYAGAGGGGSSQTPSDVE